MPEKLDKSVYCPECKEELRWNHCSKQYYCPVCVLKEEEE